MTQFVVVDNAFWIIVSIILLVYWIASSMDGPRYSVEVARELEDDHTAALIAANFAGDPPDAGDGNELFYKNQALNSECNRLMAKNKELRGELKRAMAVIADQPPILTKSQSDVIFQENGRLRDRISELEQELNADSRRRRIAYQEFRRMEVEIVGLRAELDRARDGIRA